jgi:hypothetical protein
MLVRRGGGVFDADNIRIVESHSGCFLALISMSRSIHLRLHEHSWRPQGWLDTTKTGRAKMTEAFGIVSVDG